MSVLGNVGVKKELLMLVNVVSLLSEVPMAFNLRVLSLDLVGYHVFSFKNLQQWLQHSNHPLRRPRAERNLISLRIYEYFRGTYFLSSIQ